MLRMNFNISVVIIGSNISHKIEPCILSAKKISDDIILILDNSQDDSKQKAIRLGAQVYEKPWLGYGQNKNLGINHSRYSWIFSLDSDEEISDALANSLHSMYRSEHIVYGVKRMNFIADTAIKFGSFKNDIQYRFFHKDY